MHKILLCDDDSTCLEFTQAILEAEGLYCIALSCPIQTLSRLLHKDDIPDLIILDVEMPRLDGYALAQKLRAQEHLKSIPIMFMTSRNSVKDELDAFQNGGREFVSKPVAPKVLTARVKSILENERARHILNSHRKLLAEEVQSKTAELAALQKLTIFALTSLCSERDQETGSHIRRTQLYVSLLAKKLGLPPETLERYAPLHDIGKVGIPDRILLKPGKLTPKEFEIIKTHTVIGHRAIVGAIKQMEGCIQDLQTAARIIRSHHERWDGTGYPDALFQKDIPLEARIMAIADVYDALRSERPYKNAFTHAKSKEIILCERGKQFDPDLVDAFSELQNEFEEISEIHQNAPRELEAIRARIETFCPAG